MDIGEDDCRVEIEMSHQQIFTLPGDNVVGVGLESTLGEEDEGCCTENTFRFSIRYISQ